MNKFICYFRDIKIGNATERYKIVIEYIAGFLSINFLSEYWDKYHKKYIK